MLHSGIHSILLVIWTIHLYPVVEGKTADVDCSRSYTGRPGESGVITSYNYPFDYRNNLDCQYHIITGWEQVTVCLNFYRFRLQYCTSGRLQDYLQLEEPDGPTVYQYCNKGEAFQNTPDKFANVWLDTMCWDGQITLFRKLSFKTDLDPTYPGFYLTYNVTQRPLQTKEDGDKYINNKDENLTWDKDGITTVGHGDAPCFETAEWTCFNRKCINDTQRCDGVDDCGDNSDETYTHARCTEGAYSQNMVTCDFSEASTCNLTGLMDSNGWKIASSSTDWMRGPTTDHTAGNQYRSSYTYAYFIDRSGAKMSRLFDPNIAEILDSSKPYCLSFWYYMWGPDPGRLQVNCGTNLEVWSREGSYGERWLRGQVGIRTGDIDLSSYVVFEAIRGTDNNTQINLDDISLLPGQCLRDDISCNFELDMCDYSDLYRDPNYRWFLQHSGAPQNPEEPVRDASLSGGGHYMIARYHSSSQTLLSPQFPMPYVEGPFQEAMCFRMQYATCCEDSTGSLFLGVNLYYAYSNETKSSIFLDADTGGEWKNSTLDFTASQSFNLGITPLFLTSRSRYLAVDEIQLFTGSCSEISPGRCDDGEFKCRNGECIREMYACNGREECSDGSDEEPKACCFQAQCHQDEFCCRNGGCLEYTRVCNGFNDCLDWTDEDNCSDCPSGRFQCTESKRCIDNLYRCDGKDDCWLGSDEKNCGLNVHIGTVVGLTCGILLILLIIISRIAACFYSPRSLFSKLRRWCRRRCTDDSDESEDESPPSTPVSLSHFRPPSYEDSVDNPAFMPSINSTQANLPPSYDSVSKGNFIEVTVPDASNIARLEQIAQNNSTSSDTVATVSSTVPQGIPPPPYSNLPTRPNMPDIVVVSQAPEVTDIHSDNADGSYQQHRSTQHTPAAAVVLETAETNVNAVVPPKLPSAMSRQITRVSNDNATSSSNGDVVSASQCDQPVAQDDPAGGYQETRMMAAQDEASNSPKRKAPTPNTSADDQGYDNIAFEEMPSTSNPEQGVVQLIRLRSDIEQNEVQSPGPQSVMTRNVHLQGKSEDEGYDNQGADTDDHTYDVINDTDENRYEVTDTNTPRPMLRFRTPSRDETRM